MPTNNENTPPEDKKQASDRYFTKSTPEMRARVIELASPPEDDFDRAVLDIVDDVRLLLSMLIKREPKQNKIVRKRDVEWLKKSSIIDDDGIKGCSWGECPTAFRRLSLLGLVVCKRWKHDYRAVISSTGIDELIKLLHARNNPS